MVGRDFAYVNACVELDRYAGALVGILSEVHYHLSPAPEASQQTSYGYPRDFADPKAKLVPERRARLALRRSPRFSQSDEELGK
jgi:hypothetical protein